MTNPQTPDARPGFIRMLMVNTWKMHGRIEELPLEAHTAIAAQNAAGKTSLLKLIPFFFGAAPSRIQTGRNGNKDFYSFYLPNGDSYIALEYRNAHGAVRSVVVYATNGKDLHYRLIRGPLAIDMFRENPEDPLSQFVRNADFERNAIDRGHTLHPRQIDTTRAYRAVIQGLRLSDRGQERSDHRGLVEDYGIGRLSQPLEDIDELFLTTVDKSFTVNDLLGTIIRKVTQTGSTRIRLLSGEQADQCRAIAEDHASYQDTMKAEASFRTAEHKHLAHAQLLSEIKATGAALHATAALAAEKAAACADAITAENDRHQKDGDQARATLGDINASIRSAKNEKSALERNVQGIRARREALIGQGAETAADELAEIPALRDRLRSNEAQIAALNGDRDRIDAAFREEIDKHRDLIAQESRRLNERNTEILSEGRSLSDAMRQEIEDALSAQIAHQRKHAAKLLASERELTARIDQLSDKRNQAVADPEIVARCETASGHLADKTAETAAANAALKKARADFELAEKTCRDAEMAQRAAEQSEAALEADYNRISQQLSPAAGTLRKWLEGNVPGWRSNIGRLVDERILAMTGLEPELADTADQQSVFGVRINADQLPDGCAEIEALEARLAQINTAREKARLDCLDARKAHEAAAGKRKLSRDQLSRAELIVQNATDAQSRAEQALKDAQAEADRSCRAKRDAIDEERRKIQADRTGVIEEIRTADKAAQAANTDLRNRMLSEQAARKDAQAAAEARIRAEIESLAKREVTERASIEERRRQALSEGGTNPEVIAGLQREIDNIRRIISRESGLHSLLGSWTSFLETEWARIGEMTSRIQEIELTIPTLEQELARVTASMSVAEQAHKARIDELQAAQTRLNDLVAHARQADIGAADVSDAAARDPEDIPEMIRTLRKTHEGAKQLRREIQEILEEIRDVFLGTRGMVRDYYIIARGETAKERNDIERQLGVFATWYDERHFTIRTSVIESANIQGAPIIAAYERIKLFEREINKLGGRLREALTALPEFRVVRDIDLRIRSSLSEKPFYSDMAEFAEAHQRRDIGGNTHDIDEMIRAMSSFFRAWEKSAGAGEIDLMDHVYIDGSFVEAGQLRQLGRNSDLGSLSSTGGVNILRQILLSGLVQLIRGNSDVRFTWGVDELGELDPDNVRGLIDLLNASGITVVTGSPVLTPDLMALFTHRMTIRAMQGGKSSTLLSHNKDNSRRSGIRHWTDEGMLIYPEVN